MLDFQEGGTSPLQDEVEERSTWRHHGKCTMKPENRRRSAPGTDSWNFESAAISSLHEKGASNWPESWREVSDVKRRVMEMKKSCEKSESATGRVHHVEKA